jgi:Tol biopolymer transport system component
MSSASIWLFRTDLSGSAQTLLTLGDSGLTLTAWPAYSPNGTYLYFSGTTNDNFAVWRSNADGSDAHRIYADPSGLAWRESASPDGTRLVLTAENPPVIRVFTLLTQTISSWSVPGHTPRWSPLGDLIAFTTQYGGPVFIIKPDGTGSRQVSPVGRSYAEASLTWSSDGAWLVARGPEMLELINVTTGMTVPLGYSTALVEPAWKP